VDRRFVADDIADASDRIIVGADDVAVRHLAQRANPWWLGIGATGHFEARVTEHWPGGPCAGCAHPTVEPGGAAMAPTCATISYWAGLLLAARLLRAAAGARVTGDAYATFYPLTAPGLAEIGSTPAHPNCPIDPEHRRAASSSTKP
jgi:hypothetical protein